MKGRTAKGLCISRRPNGAWRAQVRKAGFPQQSKDFLTYDEADAWGIRRLEELLTTGAFADRRPSERTTFSQVIDAYLIEVTANRPGASSRTSEAARLKRFQRVEKKLVSHAIAFLRPEMFEAWRERRLGKNTSRGLPGGRGTYKPETVPAGRTKKDGTLRSNAAAPKAPKKAETRVVPGTVRREMTLLKRVLDFAVRKFGLASNPILLVDRPQAQDERDVRISNEQIERLLSECRKSRNIWVAPMVELAIEVGPRRGSLLNLLWSDVIISKTTLILRRVKNSRSPNEVRNIEIGLTPRAIEILESLPKSIDGRVFPTTANAVYGVFKRARERADTNER